LRRRITISEIRWLSAHLCSNVKQDKEAVLMPAKPVWLLRVPHIITELRALDSPVVDRAAFERLFGVRRRRAIGLMQSIGGFQCGRTHIAKREDVIAWLEQVQAGAAYDSENRRKQRVAAQLDELHRHTAGTHIRIPVMPRSLRPELPVGIALRPGEMAVSFTTTEELLARLYAFAAAAADDFETFTAMIEGATSGTAR
jgi:hypothetical protein